MFYSRDDTIPTTSTSGSVVSCRYPYNNNVPRIIVHCKASSITLMFDVLLPFVKTSYVTSLFFYRSKLCKTSILLYATHGYED